MNTFSRVLLRELENTVGHWYPPNDGRVPYFLSDNSNTESIPQSSWVASLFSLPLFVRLKRLLNHKKYWQLMASLDLEGLNQTYDLLCDQISKDLLVRVMAFRLMGAMRIQLPLHDPRVWEDFYEISEDENQEDSVSVSHIKELRKVNLSSIGYPFSLLTTPASVFIEFCYRQYEYQNGDVHVKVCPGDIVLEGGACYGESTVFFASQCGPSGEVYAFEIVDDNIVILEKNLAWNPSLQSRVKICKEALSDHTGDTVSFAKFGAGSFSIDQWVRNDADEHDKIEAQTVSIDDFVRREQLHKVDFIKMDIEGSELSALMGATETIRRFHPKLAICLYHKLTDFVDIPCYLHELVPEYRFYLKHASVCEEETVLFATTEA